MKANIRIIQSVMVGILAITLVFWAVDRWISPAASGSIDGTLLWSTGLGILSILLVGFCLYRQQSTRKVAAQATRLREQEQLFRTLFEHSSDANLLLDQDRFFDCNAATLQLLRATTKEQVLSRQPADLSPEFQPDGRRSAEKAQEMIAAAFREGSQRFEWVHCRLDGSEVWVEVLLTTIPWRNQNILHTVWRDITQSKRAEEALRASEMRFRDLSALASDWFWEQDDQFRFTYFSSGEAMVGIGQTGVDANRLIGKTRWEMPIIGVTSAQWVAHRALLDAHQPFRDFEYRVRTDSGEERWFSASGIPQFDNAGRFTGYRGVGRDITGRQRMEEALSSRIVALTRPLDEEESVEFKDLFNIQEIQRLQDLFAEATGVASIITHVDGTPITRPSNFCRLCMSLIRNTEKGLKNCYRSDAIIGRHNPDGPIIQHCLSGGLWDAGASITVGGKHIANWLIGQVRDQAQDENQMLEYARDIKVDEQTFIEAFREVPTMPRTQFERVAWTLFALAKQLSTLAYQNVQQARFITERQQDEQRIQHLAYYDALTDLPNRMLLAQRAGLALALAARRSEALAVLFLDLDRFKQVNDSLGHTEGDELLVQVARRLREAVRETDTVCRLGGDEFVLLLPGIDLKGTQQVADKLLTAFRQPFTVAGHRLHTTLSVGIALYPHDGANFDELLKNADTALYRAKERGRNTYMFYAREMNSASVAQLVLETELRQALETGQLRAYYQPKLRLADGALTGAEALVRWQHPERGLIPPNQFIPLAEASDLIVDLGRWMLEEVCRQQVAWRDAGLPTLNVAVNLAARHFRESGLVTHIEALLALYGLPPDALELELTESTLLGTALQTTDTLHALKRLGIGLAIDDFGTGYSSLGYLKRLPITALKIDQNFVRDLESDLDDRTLAATIVALGHGLGLQVVAEGVETEQQRRILLEQGCDMAQGYLFSRPLPAEDFAAWRTHLSLRVASSHRGHAQIIL